MDKPLLKVLLFLLCFFSGCAWFKGNPKPVKQVENPKYVETGKIVNSVRLKAGGDLAVLTFRAGADVEATNELDRISLTIVKGVADALLAQPSSLKLLTSENANNAELILEGHITALNEPSKIDRWVLRDKKKQLNVDGKLVDRKSGDTILVFTHHLGTKNPKESFEDLGYKIGNNIGQFILSGVH